MSRYQVLKKLQEHSGAFVSGETLSEALGITRAAVWKSIDALRREGYEIESKTRIGYRLVSVPDSLSAEALSARIRTKTVGRQIESFDVLDSTNSYAKKKAAEGGENGLVIIADQQTLGRGRAGREFQSPAGKGLYLTALLRPSVPPMAVLPVTALAAVAACNAVQKVCGVRPGIKWTNDLVLGGKKLAGILTEMGIEGESGQLQFVALGIGINVNHSAGDFQGEVADMATSLSLALGKSVSRSALAVALIEELDRLYDHIGGDVSEYLSAYRRDCVTLGRRVRILGSGPERYAAATAVDDSFALVVRYDDGRTETVQSGEVSVRGMYGYV